MVPGPTVAEVLQRLQPLASLVRKMQLRTAFPKQTNTRVRRVVFALVKTPSKAAVHALNKAAIICYPKSLRLHPLVFCAIRSTVRDTR